MFEEKATVKKNTLHFQILQHFLDFPDSLLLSVNLDSRLSSEGMSNAISNENV